jgi:ryanodine receptor 2
METKYIPQPMDTRDVQLSDDLNMLVEHMAKNVHEVWAENRINQGWVLGEERSDRLKTHPCLVPYEQLSDEEKDYDRRTAMETLKLIIKLGFKISK